MGWIGSDLDAQKHLTGIDTSLLIRAREGSSVVIMAGGAHMYFIITCGHIPGLVCSCRLIGTATPKCLTDSKLIDSELGTVLSIWQTSHFGKERKAERRNPIKSCPPLTLDILHIKSSACVLITPLIKQWKLIKQKSLRGSDDGGCGKFQSRSN